MKMRKEMDLLSINNSISVYSGTSVGTCIYKFGALKMKYAPQINTISMITPPVIQIARSTGMETPIRPEVQEYIR
jgi:hypothetical protein